MRERASEQQTEDLDEGKLIPDSSYRLLSPGIAAIIDIYLSIAKDRWTRESELIQRLQFGDG